MTDHFLLRVRIACHLKFASYLTQPRPSLFLAHLYDKSHIRHQLRDGQGQSLTQTSCSQLPPLLSFASSPVTPGDLPPPTLLLLAGTPPPPLLLAGLLKVLRGIPLSMRVLNPGTYFHQDPLTSILLSLLRELSTCYSLAQIFRTPVNAHH